VLYFERMKTERGLWDRLTQGVVLLLILAALLAVVMWYLPVIQQNQRLRQEVWHLDRQVQLEEARQKQLQLAIDALQHDPRTVERYLRQSLGFARPGETVIRFEAPTPGTNQ